VCDNAVRIEGQDRTTGTPFAFSHSLFYQA
jgi:hypothetical protein